MKNVSGSRISRPEMSRSLSVTCTVSGRDTGRRPRLAAARFRLLARDRAAVTRRVVTRGDGLAVVRARFLPARLGLCFFLARGVLEAILYVTRENGA